LEEITVQLRRLVADRLNLNLAFEEVQPDVQLLEGGLRLDSLALVELITLIEDQFAIQFDENDFNVEAFGSLRSLAGVIGSRRSMAASA